jgi:hypothetical protein
VRVVAFLVCKRCFLGRTERSSTVALSEDFLELMRDAQTAIEELLHATRLDAFPSLRKGYGEIRSALDLNEQAGKLRDAQTALKEMREEVAALRDSDKSIYGSEAWTADQAARKATRIEWERWKNENWVDLSRHERRHRILNMLGDTQMTIGEIVSALNSGKPEKSLPMFYSDLLTYMNGMTATKEIVKVKIGSRGKQPRYTYARNRTVSAEVESLERALIDGEVA